MEVVITGATSGIGAAMARELAAAGARLTLLVRDEPRGAAAARELGATTRVVRCDLADLRTVRAAATELHERLDRIDVLVSNAGMRSFAGGETADGFELMVGTNHLGPFLLANLLLDLLRAAPQGRIVVTASEAHRLSGRPDLATLGQPVATGALGAERRYGQSKLLGILFTKELARRLGAGSTVTANCFCPGAVATGLVRDTRVLDVGGRLLARTPLMRTPEQGARAGVRLALDPALSTTTGQFVSTTPGLRRLPPVSARTDLAYARAAWERSAALVGL